MTTDPKQPLQHSPDSRAYRLGLSLILALVALAALSVAPASATKTHLRLEAFSSAAQPKLNEADSLAVDQSSGDLLVIDSAAKTLSRYHPDGTPDNFSALATNVIDAKGAGDQTPQNGFFFATPGEQQVAVDISGTLTNGDIYVTQGNQEAGHLIDVFASSGAYLGQLTGTGAAKFGTMGSFPFSPCGVAVDATGNLFVGAGYDEKVFKFDPSANPPLDTDLVATYSGANEICNLAAGAGPSAGSLFASEFTRFDNPRNRLLYRTLSLSSAGLGLQSIIDPEETGHVVAVDPATGHLYIGSPSPDSGHAVAEFDASGSLVSTFAGGSATGIAIDSVRNRIYVSSAGGGGVSVYGPVVTIPDVTTGTASISGDTSLTLNGSVDPDGVPLEECSFQYGTTNAYGQSVPCSESPAEIGTAAKAVHADLAGLDAETLYHYRLVAKNSNATVNGSDQTVKTPSKPAINGEWVIDVGTAEATLKGQVNPENSPTTYRFEWGTDASYGHVTAERAIGSDNTGHLVSLVLDDLAPGTTYHYRVVAGNGIGETEGPDHTFITYPQRAAAKADCPNQAFRSGASADLPDCRAYEMVSPVDKNGSDIKNLVQAESYPTRLDQSSTDGERFTYSSSAAFGDAVSAPFAAQYLATREASGWSTHAISPPRGSASLNEQPSLKFDAPFKLFSPDLSDGWMYHDTEPPLDECAPPGFVNLYHRDNATGRYEALMTGVPPSIPSTYRPELQGVSADGTRAVIRANVKLTEGAAKGEGFQLYEHVKDEGCGELRLISALPNGKAITGSSSVGTAVGAAEYRRSTVSRGVSADGSRVFFTVVTSQSPSVPLYVRVNADQEQSAVSGGKCTEPELACTLLVATGPARFWTAAVDGSKVIYSAGGGLYEFDVDKALAGETANTLIAANAKGVAGASDDASRVYFVSGEELGGEGEAGKQNLYLYDSSASGADRSRLVATLEDDGGVGGMAFTIASESPVSNGVRVTADGSHLAFVSTTSLTGYDNTDVADGRPDLEIFVYDAGTGKLACVSCNPSGARPAGRFFLDLETRRVAAELPRGETQTFTPRVLSANGNRLFFESFEALLPRDTNGKADVYEWQRASSRQECEATGAELFVPGAGGCLSLISSGQSPIDSEIADASPDGHDVFIRTAASLLPQDPGLVDIYDAREDGGQPQPPGTPAACEGEACQGPLAPPNDPTPASSAFEGAGNVNEKPKAKKKKKAHKKKQAKKHQKQAKHKRRARR
jgi:hypothetical protein